MRSLSGTQDCGNDPCSTWEARVDFSLVRAAPRTKDYYPDIDALADRGAHRPVIHIAADNPRRYQGRCFDCSWRGSETTGKWAELEMLEHAKATLPPAR